MGDDLDYNIHFSGIPPLNIDPDTYRKRWMSPEEGLDLTIDSTSRTNEGPDGLPGLPSKEELLRRERNQSPQGTGLPQLGDLMRAIEEPPLPEPSFKNVLIPIDTNATAQINYWKTAWGKDVMMYPIEVLGGSNLNEEYLDSLFSASLVPSFLSVYARHPESMFVFCHSYSTTIADGLFNSRNVEWPAVAPAIARHVTMAPKKMTVYTVHPFSAVASNAFEDAVPKR